jgi:hypothetical protein
VQLNADRFSGHLIRIDVIAHEDGAVLKRVEVELAMILFLCPERVSIADDPRQSLPLTKMDPSVLTRTDPSGQRRRGFPFQVETL